MQVDKERLALVIADNIQYDADRDENHWIYHKDTLVSRIADDIADQIRDKIMNIVNSYVNVKGNPEKDGKALARKIVFDLAAED